MTLRGWRWAVTLAVAGLAVAGLAPASPAQETKPAATPAPAAAPPADSNYVGADTCKGCHEEAWNKFAKTRMGRLFLYQARDAAEKNACENCHGRSEERRVGKECRSRWSP